MPAIGASTTGGQTGYWPILRTLAGAGLTDTVSQLAAAIVSLRGPSAEVSMQSLGTAVRVRTGKPG